MAAVLVHIDLDGDGNRPHSSSLAALAAGRTIASSWGATLYAAVVIHDGTERGPGEPETPARVVTVTPATVPALKARIEALRSALARASADKVVVALADVPPSSLWAAVGNAWQGVLDHLRPRLVLFGADAPSAAELGPRTGARIGARLLLRARAVAGDEVELRDRDGGHARATDGGAAVVLVGGAVGSNAGDDDVDVLVLAVPGGGDARVELAGTKPADLAYAVGAIVAIGDDVAGDAAIAKRAHELARLLGAELVGGSGAARVVAPEAVLDRGAPLAPELCVSIGAPTIDLAGAAGSIQIGVASKTADGVLAGVIGPTLDELVRRLEHA